MNCSPISVLYKHVIRGCVLGSILVAIGLILTILYHNAKVKNKHIEYEKAALKKNITEVLKGQRDDIYLYDSINTDSLIYDIQQLKGLRSLELDSTDISNVGMSYIINIPDLHTLNIKGARQIDDCGIKLLAGHPHLEEMVLWNSKITDDGIAEMKRFPKLKKLSLLHVGKQSNHPTDKALDSIAEISSLETLIIAGTWYSQQAVELLKKRRPYLNVKVGKSM
jgi:hypothetical protein